MSALSYKMTEKVIKEGSHVLLKKENVYKAIEIRRHRKVAFERLHFSLEDAIGCPLGSSFEVKDGKLVKVENLESPENETATSNDKEILDTDRDNRNINDDGSSQKLSRDDIMTLKAKGLSGEEIVEHLIENSASFSERTEFSKEKYIKKKKKKYVNKIMIVEPTTRLICEMYYAKGPGKINDLRIDTIAQILCMAGVCANRNVLVVEQCQGLLLGAVMERMGGFGKLVQIYFGDFPNRSALECFNFTKDEMKMLTGYPLSKVTLLGTKPEATELKADEDVGMEHDQIEEELVEDSAQGVESTTDQSDQRERIKDARRRKRKAEERISKEILQTTSMDSLIIACKAYPKSILMALLPYLPPSRPFVVYSPYKEPLLDCYVNLRNQNKAVHIKVTEAWWRHYQVLEGRTRPEIMMKATGGYLLTGITVE